MGFSKQKLFDFLIKNNWKSYCEESEEQYETYSVNVDNELGSFGVHLIFGMKENSLVLQIYSLYDPNWENKKSFEIVLPFCDIYGDKPTAVLGVLIPFKGKLKKEFLEARFLPMRKARCLESVQMMFFLFGINQEEFDEAMLKKSF